MVEQAVRDLDLDLKRSIVIGDKASDIELGKRLNLKTVLVLTGYGKETLRKMTREHAKPDYVCHTLAEAAQWQFNRIFVEILNSVMGYPIALVCCG